MSVNFHVSKSCFRIGSCVGSLMLCLLGGGCQFTQDSGAISLSEVVPDPTHLKAEQATQVQLAYARTLEQKGKRDKAAATYERILDADPTQAKALHRLAILRDQQGQSSEAERLFREALRQQPGEADLFCDIGYSYYLQRRWSEAEINLRQAIALSPTHRVAHNHLGLVLVHLGETEEALSEFRRAGCTTAESHANAGFALTMARRVEEAKQQYRLAKLVEPDSQQIASRLKELDALTAYLPQSERAYVADAPAVGAGATAVNSNASEVRLTSGESVTD